MRILMFGWDFPPVKNGGLGVACLGLTRALVDKGVEVVFVLPHEQPVADSPLRFVFAGSSRARLYPVASALRPYSSSNTPLTLQRKNGHGSYERRLIDEVYRYARAGYALGAREQFDVIHAHDWTSYCAGMEAKRASGKPLILHVHATAYDQAGGGSADPEIHAIEREAFEHADAIIAVSNHTKNVIVQEHGIDPSKIIPIHNGADALPVEYGGQALASLKASGKKIVLFHGRITIQKGPDYFIRAAARVLEHDPDVIFVISGWGDMEAQILREAAELGIADKVLFAGSLWGKERDSMYQSADVLVMPSVSEPFGLVPLEAIQNGTPVLISKQSGVSEVLSHALKTDFWDIDEMANKILAVLHHAPLGRELVANGQHESEGITWEKAAGKCTEVYRSLVKPLTA